jgi:SAM-dependent methyltransferase
LLKRFRRPRTGAWIVLDRLMEASATLFFGFAGAIFLVGMSQRNAMLGLFALIACAIGITLAIVFRRDFSLRLRGILRPEQRRGILQPIFGFVCDAAEEVRALGARTPLLGLVTVLATAMDIAIAFCLYASLGEHVAYFTLGAAQCAHALVSVIPISANVTGIPYAVSAGILHEAAGVPLDVLAAAIAVRFLMAAVVFWTSFAVGTRSLFRRSRFADQGALFDYLASGEVLYRYSEAALQTVRRAAGPVGSALDIGCGDGVITHALEGKVIGVDISPKCVRGAVGRGIPAVVADASRALPFREEQFDTVTCVDVLHHLDRRWETLLTELGRVVKPGGRLVLIEPDARNAFVRWTQAPGSPIRIAPWPNEPAIYPEELMGPLAALGYTVTVDALSLDGEQSVRDVFPMWQRVLKAPLVIVLAMLYKGRANKFVLIAEKPSYE